MSLTHPITTSGTPEPLPERPDRATMLRLMLDQTARGGVPIRRAFLQRLKADDSGIRGAALASLVRTRDVAALDAYLLIHAMASSSDPYRTWFPSSTWAQITGLDEYAGAVAAKARWSKIVTKLVRSGLVRRERSGNKMNYWLLNESGDGTPYKRPTALSHGSWFSIPHSYWIDGHDQRLSLAEKAMLLIALDQPDGFRLPYDRLPAWYGISASTAERGLTSLLASGFITMSSSWQPEPKSASGWSEIRLYTTDGIWSQSSRRTAITNADRARKPRFTSSPVAAQP